MSDIVVTLGIQWPVGPTGETGATGPQGSMLTTIALPMGELSLTDNVTATVITTQSTWTLVAPGWTLGTAVAYDEPTDGRLRYTGALTGHTHMGCTMSVSSAGTNNVLKGVIVKNATVNANNEYAGGTVLSAGTIQFKNGAPGDVNSTAIHVMTHFMTNDTMSLFIQNMTNTSDLTVVHANLFVMGPLGLVVVP